MNSPLAADPITPLDKQRRLDAVECWIFDLDNTLYPASSRLFDQVHRRMTRFIADRFGLDHDAARERQRKRQEQRRQSQTAEGRQPRQSAPKQLQRKLQRSTQRSRCCSPRRKRPVRA